MRKFLIVLLLNVCCMAAYAQDNEILTNQTVLEMTELGFESDVIISKIQTTGNKFDLTLEALKELKAKNVPGAVIAAMVKAGKKETVAEEKTGIFSIQADGNEQRIFPTAFSGTKTRTLAAGLTYGIASGKIKSVLNNPVSRNVVPVNNQTFMFYFLPFKDNQLAATDWWFRATTSPNEFVLIRLDVNKNKGVREVETGKANMWVGTDAGVKNSKVIEFSVEDMGNGMFKVIPNEMLVNGEYCFFYQGAIPQGGYNNQSVFDFSIQ